MTIFQDFLGKPEFETATWQFMAIFQCDKPFLITIDVRVGNCRGEKETQLGSAFTESLANILLLFTAIMVTRAIINLMYGGRKLESLSI